MMKMMRGLFRALGLLIGISSCPALLLGSESTSLRNPETRSIEEAGNLSESRGVAPAARDTNQSFAAGTRNVTIYPSVAAGKTARRVYGGHVGLGYHLIDNLSFNVEGVGYFINQTADTGALGLNLLPRWHYLRNSNWSLYLDGGAGFILSRKPIGESGTHFNFALQGGAGATYDLTEAILPVAGIRWFHISNGRIKGKDRNVGFDSPAFYLGLMMPF